MFKRVSETANPESRRDTANGRRPESGRSAAGPAPGPQSTAGVDNGNKKVTIYKDLLR